VAAVVLGVVCGVCGLAYLARWHRVQRWEATERKLLRSNAQIWGLSTVPGETNRELRARIDAAMRAGRTGDPIETAARALRAQRERALRQS
jgi:hypothetical protein